MSNNAAKTPQSISLIAYGFIGLGLIGIISGCASFFTVPLMKKILINIAAGYEQPMVDFGPAFKIIRYAPIMAICSIALGIFTVYTSLMFLKLQSWARLMLEMFSWIGLVLSILIAMLFAYSFIRLVPMLALLDDPVFASALRTTIILCMIVAIFFVAPNLLLVVYLRSKKVRQAMQQ